MGRTARICSSRQRDCESAIEWATGGGGDGWEDAGAEPEYLGSGVATIPSAQGRAGGPCGPDARGAVALAAPVLIPRELAIDPSPLNILKGRRQSTGWERMRSGAISLPG